MNSKLFTQTVDRFYLWLVAVVVVATVTLAYSNTFQVPFIFDDAHNITKNVSMKFSSITFASLHQAATESPSAWRYFSNISFALNYYYGGQNVFGYHLVNLLLHISTALVFYFLVLSTLRLPIHSGRYKHTREIALFAALLWALHPVQTNGVTYIVQRMTTNKTNNSERAILL